MMIDITHPTTGARAFVRAASVQRAQALLAASDHDPLWHQSTARVHRDDGDDCVVYVSPPTIAPPLSRKKRYANAAATDSTGE